MLKVVCNLKKASIMFTFALIFSASLALLVGRDASALTGGTVDTDVRVHPSLTLNLTSGTTPTSNVTLNLDPASNSFDYEDLNVSVGTNNAAGYVLTMSATDSNLVNVADSSKTIPTLATKSGGYTDSDFTTNAWGYKNGTTNNYFPFVSGATILSNSVRANNDTTTLRFAAKVDYTKPSGLYEQNLNFTLTANMATYYMQDLDPAICSADPIEAIDTRDNNTYWVAKLADGNCWMLNNLQLGNKLATTTGTMTLTPANSNVSQNWVLTNKLSDGKFPYNTTAVTDDVAGILMYIYDDNAFYCTPDGTNNYVGCYYNWYTATAGAGTSNFTGKDDQINGVDVNESICPRGWVLPGGGSISSVSNNFRKLYEAMGSPSATQMLVDPATALDNIGGVSKPGFLLSGIYTATELLDAGTKAHYWSRSAQSNTRGYAFTISESAVGGNGYNVKREGLSIRCIRETRKIYDIENMQDMSPAIVGNTNVGSFKQLKDTRDNQYYMVGKLEDGNVWMLDNLNLDLTNATVVNNLSPSNTNADAASLTSLRSGNRTAGAQYATAGLTLTDWTNEANNYSAPLANKNGTCSTTRNCTYNGNYTNDTVLSTLTPDPSTFGIGSGKIGIRYNYCAVSAGSYCFGNGSSGGTASGDIVADICPSSWHLPTGGTGSNSDFQNLYNVIAAKYPSTVDDSSSPNSFQAILSTPMSGGYISNGATFQGKVGGFWTATYESATNIYQSDIFLTNISLGTSDFRTSGKAVRCLAR